MPCYDPLPPSQIQVLKFLLYCLCKMTKVISGQPTSGMLLGTKIKNPTNRHKIKKIQKKLTPKCGHTDSNFFPIFKKQKKTWPHFKYKKVR